MPNAFAPFDYGQVARNVENVRGARTRNALAQTQFTQQQQEYNTKRLYQALVEMSENPRAADKLVPELKQLGILRSDFDHTHMTHEQIKQTATERAAAIGKALGMDAPKGKGPSAVQEYNFYQELSPENKDVFLQIKRAQPNAKFLDKGDTIEVREPVKAGLITTINKTIPPEKKPGHIKEVETVKADVQRKAEVAKKLPKARSSLKGTISKIKLMKSKTQEARSLVGPFTTGTGAWLSIMPGSKAKRLEGVIETIKANLGFGELAEMRATSPTGGAVGQLSDRELKVLSAVKQALDQAQSGKDVMDALDMLDDQLTGMGERVQEAFDQDFLGKQPTEKPSADLSIDDLVNKYAPAR